MSPEKDSTVLVMEIEKQNTALDLYTVEAVSIYAYVRTFISQQWHLNP